jgi:hypothetical protein
VGDEQSARRACSIDSGCITTSTACSQNKTKRHLNQFTYQCNALHWPTFDKAGLTPAKPSPDTLPGRSRPCSASTPFVPIRATMAASERLRLDARRTSYGSTDSTTPLASPWSQSGRRASVGPVDTGAAGKATLSPREDLAVERQPHHQHQQQQSGARCPACCPLVGD